MFLIVGRHMSKLAATVTPLILDRMSRKLVATKMSGPW